MKILRITNDYIQQRINKNSLSWEDMNDISDIADSMTNEQNDLKNPLTTDFWQFWLFENNLDYKNYLSVTDVYKKLSS
jgi:hypothetical protein